MGICCLAPDIASAQCSYQPFPAFETTICTGSTPQTIAANEQGSTLEIQSGASVGAVNAASVPVVLNSGPYYPQTTYLTITNNGQITNGLTVDSGPILTGAVYGPNVNVALTVGTGGLIGGSTAIDLIAESGNGFNGTATLSLDNQGSIQSTSGPAITGNGNANAVVSSLTNEASGTIGGIQAVVTSLNNAGTISGGSGSAIDTTTSNGSTVYQPLTWQNSGTITSNSAAPTINAAGSGPLTLTNSGQITNTGSGSAINVPSSTLFYGAEIVNQAGGTISSSGGTAIASAESIAITNAGTITGNGYAIQTSGVLNLVSTGTINGSVEADNAGGYGGSIVNLSGGGGINGSLTLGAASYGYAGNTVIVDYSGGANLLSSITGSVTIGGNTNELILNLPGSMTLNSAINLPAEFSTLSLQLASGSTVTLDSGFSTPVGLVLNVAGQLGSGAATLVNAADLSTTGAALTASNVYSGIAIVNTGTITANFSGLSSYGYAVTAELAYGGTALTNSGTITAIGGNGVDTYGAVANSGTITADGTALTVVYGAVTNSGTISGGNTGIYAIAGQITNTGTISGGQTGADLISSTLTNSGTVTSSGGPAVTLEAYSTLDNLQGGVIDGNVIGQAFYNVVSNAGTINGNVNLGPESGFETDNTYYALAGGVLNGNLNLGGGGDKLVIDLSSTGTGMYPGITGTVTGSGTETLLWLATADTTATLSTPNGVFSVIGYDLSNNADLTLTATGTQAAVYTFAGTGTVNLTADISGNGTSSLLTLNTTSIQTDSSGNRVPTALDFTSNGNLTVSGSTSMQAAPAVLLSDGSSFTNNGTISYNNLAPAPTYAYAAPAAAIYNGGTVTNNGTIAVGGGDAIVGNYYTTSGSSVVNTGSIVQIAGAADAVGIYDVSTVTNSGTIATGGMAVVFDYNTYNTLTNSGTISSSDAVAIGSDSGNYEAGAAQVTNSASGVISGGTGQAAITLGGNSAVVNRGTINGDVQLGVQSNPFGAGSIYIADGGTLNGNLTFGGNGNTLVVIGASTGVTGTISTGNGTSNLYAQGYTSSTSVDLSAPVMPAGFQSYGVGAIGADTTVTLTGPAGGLNSGFVAFGDGTVVNTATVNFNYGANVVTLGGGLNSLLGETAGVTFVNSGTLSDGVQGFAQSFTNTGTIGSQDQYTAGVTLYEAPVSSFTFDNSGQIWGSAAFTASTSTLSSILGQVTIENSGNISGAITGSLAADQFSFVNSGVVNIVDLSIVDPQASSSVGLASVTNTSSGLVDVGFTIQAGSHNLAFSNAGQIAQYLFLSQSTGTTDEASASISNSGSIAGVTGLYLGSTNVTFANSGTIASTLAYDYNYGGLTLTNTTVGDGTVTFANSGTIANAASGESAALISVTAGSTSAPATATVNVTNTGSISATGGGILVPFYNEQYFATGLAVSATASGGTASITITNAAGASITASGADSAGYYGSLSLPPELANIGSIALIASAQTVSVTNAGTITGSIDTPNPAGEVSLVVSGITLPTTMARIAGAIDLIGNTVSLTNTGTINGNSILYSENATFANYGTINGSVTLGDGSGLGTATAIEGLGATLNGTVTGTAATNTLEIDVSGGGTISQAVLDQIQSHFSGFSTASLTGSGTVSFSGPLSETLVLNNAALTLAAGQTLQATNGIALAGGTGTNSFTNYGTVDGAIVNVDTTNAAGGVVNIGTTATSDATFTNDTGAQLNITAGTFTVSGLMTNAGDVTIADGATFDATGGIANTGTLLVQAGGTVNDTLVNSGAVVIDGTYNADIDNLAGGTITASGTVTAPSLIQNAGTFTGSGATVSTPEFDNLSGGVLAGTVTFGTPGGTLLVNQGTISGAVTFGSGSNELLLGSGSQITGTVTGGSGTNLLAIQSSATDAAPDQFALGGVTGFQTSQLLSGSVALSGSYTTGSFNVLGGHLIGNAGSVLNVGTITVASGAAFGSAGTVNGNVTVNGTLAPVGTMTVKGNVALTSGSTALFAATSTQPQLAVSGKVSIAGGSSLTLSGTVSTRQGTLVQLISASGGISGAFTLTGTASSLDQINTGTLLELYRPFVAGAGFGTGAASALSAVNALVVSGEANSAQIAALTTLDNAQGTADGGKFARLSPEAYATATQIGIDNGLQIADTLRNFDYDSVAAPLRGSGHAFTFAEALGNWTHANGDVGTGTSSATSNAGGILGGLGLRTGNGMISGFVGGSHDQQTIAALGSTTSAHATLFGVNALAWYNDLDASITVAWDNGTAQTSRVLPDGTTAYGSYGLRAMVADMALGYTIHDALGFTMRPQVGVTHVTVHRDAVDEENSNAFALDVQGERRRLDFVDGSWRVAPTPTATSTFMPWVSMGFRVRLNGDGPQAVAFLPGASDAIVADGVLRAKTAVTFKAGFSYALTPAASLYATFDGERGSGSNATGVNGGIRFAF